MSLLRTVIGGLVHFPLVHTREEKKNLRPAFSVRLFIENHNQPDLSEKLDEGMNRLASWNMILDGKLYIFV